jgi:hypothetical protein
MGILHDLLEQRLVKLGERGEIPQDRVVKAIEGAAPQIAELILTSIKRGAAKNLKERRSIAAAFRQRTFRRWRAGLELLEVFCAIAGEIGEAFNAEFRPKAVEEKNLAFEAAICLHAKSLLIAQEIICLLQGGFADGALARWRSLHEASITANFIVKHGNETAQRYLVAWRVQAYQAMVQYQRFADRIGESPFSQSELDAARQDCEMTIAKFGKSLKNRYGWAGLLPNFQPIISRVRRVFRASWERFVCGFGSCLSQFFRPPFTP